MDILYALEELRTPVWNVVFSAITYLGDQTVCIAAVLLLLWCFDKQKGYCLFLIAATGTAINQLLKAIFLIPRPWVKDPDFTIVESARAAATGYSFPSGHTQNVTAEFSAIALWAKRRWVSWLCAAIILLTGFSRMYLGVHTPLDVGVSLGVGLLTSVVCIRLFDRLRPGTIRWIILAAMALMVGYLLLAPKGPANVAEFDLHGLESAYSLAGAAVGLCIAWRVDERYLHYDTRAPPAGPDLQGGFGPGGDPGHQVRAQRAHQPTLPRQSPGGRGALLPGRPIRRPGLAPHLPPVEKAGP